MAEVGLVLWRFLRTIRARVCPTAQQRELARFYANGGRELLFNDLTLDGHSVVIDAGGYDGQWASDLYGRYCSKIMIFEPVRRHAATIKSRFCKNSSITVVAAGLGGKARREVIHVSGAESSIFGRGPTRETIEIFDVVDVWRQFRLNTVDLLKLNIEGCEYEVLERLITTGFIKNIKTLLVQFHRISMSSRNRRLEIARALEMTHQTVFRYEFVWERWDRVVEKWPQ